MKSITCNAKNLTKRAWSVNYSEDYSGLEYFLQVFIEQGKYSIYLGNSYNYKIQPFGKFEDIKEALKNLKDLQNKTYNHEKGLN